MANASYWLKSSKSTIALCPPPTCRSNVVTDSVPPFRLDPAALRDKLVVLDSAPLFAEAIRRIDRGGSITELVEV